MLKAACISIAIAAVLIAPNALWLVRSTLRIENRGSGRVASVVLEACSERFELGGLAAGSSVFQLLPKCGDDTLTISSGSRSFCTLYVEGSLYHIQAWFSSPAEGDCEYASPPFSPLLITQLL